jgi:excisionase family DNA binding protein
MSKKNGDAPLVTHLTPEMLAQRWGISRYSVYARAKAHQIPVLRIGRAVRFRVTDIERFEEQQVQQATGKEKKR